MHTTAAKQLAMYPIFLSGLQMMADVPENYGGHPGLEFLERVPTTWDDTKVLNGQMGGLITVARRSGRDWFVGSMTDEQPETLSVPLRFLEPRTPYVASIYGDAPTTDLETNPNQIEVTRLIIGSGDTLVAPLAEEGKPCSSRRPPRATSGRFRVAARPHRSAPGPVAQLNAAGVPTTAPADRSSPSPPCAARSSSFPGGRRWARETRCFEGTAAPAGGSQWAVHGGRDPRDPRRSGA